MRPKRNDAVGAFSCCRIFAISIILLGFLLSADLLAEPSELGSVVQEPSSSTTSPSGLKQGMAPIWGLYACVLAGIFFVFITVNKLRHDRNTIKLKNKVLRQELELANAEVNRYRGEVSSVYSSVNQGIFSVDKQGIIQPNYSKYLEKIFETQEIAGREVVDLMFLNECLGMNQLFQVRQSIETIVGELDMNFDFNSHLLLREYTLQLKRGRELISKHLEIDWTPVSEDGKTVNLIVSIRDVSALREADAFAQECKNELEITRQLFGISRDRFNKFESITTKSIEDSREILLLKTRPNERAVNKLIVNIESIKNNAMESNFHQVSNVSLAILASYIEIQKNDFLGWNKKQLSEDLDKLEKLVDKYASVYRRDIDKYDTSSSTIEPKGLWFDFDIVDKLQTSIEAEDIGSIESIITALRSSIKTKDNGVWVNDGLVIAISDNLKSRNLEVLKNIFNTIQSEALDALLDEVLGSNSGNTNRGETADSPNITVSAPLVRIKRQAFPLVNKVFNEIINCGISGELAASAVNSGAPPHDMDIYTVIDGSTLEVHMKDNGRGINLEELYKQGFESGLWDGAEMPSVSQVADVIFDSYCTASTNAEPDSVKSKMGEIKQILKDSGGDVSLKLLDENRNQPLVPFELVVKLPETCFYRTH